jgi:hypothetical protein
MLARVNSTIEHVKDLIVTREQSPVENLRIPPIHLYLQR